MSDLREALRPLILARDEEIREELVGATMHLLESDGDQIRGIITVHLPITEQDFFQLLCSGQVILGRCRVCSSVVRHAMHSGEKQQQKKGQGLKINNYFLKNIKVVLFCTNFLWLQS